MKRKCYSCILFGILLLAGSCLESDRNLYVKLTSDQYFDFNLNQELTLSIDYGFAVNNYVVLFELYDQNPLETKEDGTQEKKEIEPIYRAATDGSGKYTGKIQILSALNEVWLYCDYPGAVSLAKLEIKNQILSFDQQAYIAALMQRPSAHALLTPNKHKYPDGWKVLDEDLWPEAGDYDMNDIMVSYRSTVHRKIVGNRVFKIVDEFTPYNDGGTRKTDFGYQLSSLNASHIKKVTIEGASASTHMGGQILELGQGHPTILVFDNIKQGVLNQKNTVTIEINEIPEDMVRPPYNPFILSHSTRGKEVHLPKYMPTNKADVSLFGTKGDGSRPEEKLDYVVSHWLPQMLFAINLPNVKDFLVPKEQEKITDTYPLFQSWISSGGSDNKDWYKKPQKT